jgi:tellurite resistance protein TerC
VTDSIGSPLLWAGFTAFVLTLLILDLAVFHRKPHVIGVREAGFWVIMWVSIAALFNVGIYIFAGTERGLEFTAGYLVELALSVDNMFVFALIFTYFLVPRAYQHRVLFWGILGALVMRLIFILLGAALLDSFHWIIYVFGGFLIFTGIKILRNGDTHIDPDASPVMRLFRRFVPMTRAYHEQRFLVIENGKHYATPLLAVLVLVEATDLVFALDSVPAIFAITNDPFIVYSSNVFAILGLRSLYFLLSGVMDLFRFLKVGLGAVLVFVGSKMVLSDTYHIPIGISLGVIVLLIGGSVVLSILIKDVTEVETHEEATSDSEAEKERTHSH